MAQKFNWGAALTTLGRGLGDYAEQQRRERTAALLREQALDDENRRREQEMADRAALLGPILQGGLSMPNREALAPEDPRAFVGRQFGVDTSVGPYSSTVGYAGLQMPTDIVGGMHAKPAVELWKSMQPEIPKPQVYDYYMTTPEGGYAGFSGNPWSAAGEGRRVNISGTYQGRPVAAFENWSAPKTTNDADGGYYVTDGTGEPVFYPQSPSMLDGTLAPAGAHNGRPLLRYTPGTPSSNAPKDPKDVVAEWYGGEKQSGDFDPKTGTATPFSYPFRGSVFDPVTSPIDVIPDLTNAVRNEQAQGRGVATEQDARRLLEGVLGGYDVDLARQMDIDLGAQFQGWQPNTSGGKAVPGEYRKARGPWGFDNTPEFARGATDWMVGDDIKSAAEFYADIVNKQLADGTDEVEMRTINAWLKKKGLTLDQLAQYLKASRAQGVDLPAAGAAVVNQRAAAADTSISKY